MSEGYLQNERPGRGRRILVVDDGAITRLLLERTLKGEGFEVFSAKDGAHALELMGAALPEVVVSDLEMPNLNGIELCRAMRMDSRLSSIAVILTTANEVTETDRKSAIEAGATAFVSRTTTFQEVMSALFLALDATFQQEA